MTGRLADGTFTGEKKTEKTLLGKMSWKEFEAALARKPVVLFPVGATEMHGHHLPLGNDFLMAQGVAERVAEKTGAVVAPLMPFGCSDSLRSFPGTLSIRAESLSAVVQDVCDCLIGYGVERILFIGPHAGNRSPIESVGRRIRKQYGLITVSVDPTELAKTLSTDIYPDVPSNKFGGHGGLLGTTMMMALAPDAINWSLGTTGEMGKFEGLQARSSPDFKFQTARCRYS